MPYRIEPGEKVIDAVRRMATEMVDKALAEVADESLNPHKTVHQVRKRCKKVRGLIRLVRPSFAETYRRENIHYRDAARPLSYVRDAAAILECVDRLLAAYGDAISPELGDWLIQRLQQRRDEEVADEDLILARLATFAAELRDARGRIESWKLSAKGFRAIRGGLVKTYARAMNARRFAYRNPTAENFHEWRKRAKYHGYHYRILENLWPPVTRVYIATASEISDLLGDDHDLHVLKSTLLAEPQRFDDPAKVQTLVDIIDARRPLLQAEARQVSRRLQSDRPAAMTRRIGSWWKAWRQNQTPSAVEVLNLAEHRDALSQTG